MVVVVGKPETAESVRELNFRHEFEIGEIHERSVSTIQHQLEQDAEHITHLVYDIRAIGNVDASLALLGRICTTIPGITGKTIVVTEGIAGSSSFMRDVCEMYPKEQIVQSHGAELKRVLNAMLCADGIIRTEPEPQKVTAADPVPDPQEPPPSPPIPVEVTPPSQVGREAAQAQLVLPKPKIERSATCIAVAGAGHRIGTTTQPSEVELAADVLRVDNGTIHYIFSFVPQRDRPDVLASMEQYGERTYFAGWTPDYFLYSGNDELYGKITGQIKPKSKAVQKKSHKWPWRKK